VHGIALISQQNAVISMFDGLAPLGVKFLKLALAQKKTAMCALFQ
jgi:hypothetical protein